jgi:putative addiction module killer protein
MEQGNLAKVKPVGEGVLEYKIDFGPGYWVYFGRDGELLLILLTGGTAARGGQLSLFPPPLVGRIMIPSLEGRK